jgi:hypothetical protein
LFSWCDELVGADFGDIRRTERLVKIVEALSEKPEASIPEACRKRAEAKAAYRFFDNDAVTSKAILQPHVERTVERARRYPRVLAIQDTTEINLTTHRSTAGLGYLGNKHCRGFMLHSLLCVSTQGVPLGILDQRCWTRDPAEFGKRAARNAKPIHEKESQRWLDGLAAADECLGGKVPVVVVGDSESDIYDVFTKPRAPDVDLLVRVYHRKRLVRHPDRHLYQAVRASEPRAIVEIEVPRADDRKPRRARLTMRWCRLNVCEPANYRGIPAAKPVELWFLHLLENDPPSGAKRLEWLLATTVPLTSLADALEVMRWYTFRWRIERFHFVLKSGCKIEDRCLREESRMENLLATLSVVAWRLLWLTYEARENPSASGCDVFDRDELTVLHLATHRRTPVPQQPPTIGQVILDIAKLGGYMARRSDLPPGVKVIWRGLRKLEAMTDGYRLAMRGKIRNKHEDFG